MAERKLTQLGADAKKALIDRRMSQRELADELGISSVYLNMIFFGERRGRRYAVRIMEKLGLDPERYQDIA